ncbi:hypothetical protein COS31_00055 [Candidatus Roizmanbacteria bacterium CG02_land_8_20_14_3_00_36_15]|uniref:AbiEi antitoxin C-terminal domain-containing protein n=2 Tax=Candidatus Roizmaniibacteriota TaxID=1752723 RepID=A0A2M8KKI9_9BACT|nr:MAG: hypothetical protein COS51_00945 [Candidatus Roizmanbacteria bacterium CG03_land_8_20_14_0_80_36_21]PIV38323.1 MAG: hypothetical protein COS31_00055 [Candidatus Roizmanbacteria bacterium CG02_land_8_20_14_3_00_36_15]PIY69809.1 MAG: hypothetical protein COY89_04460 [Candidatus Roizmanbacteria bacterium CG_4_10_14_0_8_um_filter_36_36]PJA52971.1 MAG: hypothetical protein CO166_03490 [Candidatus Roizmanbacteria bacterium CG_4_9_14_3_um_filter_36_11]PJC81242.1 MAG: hypothetical protein CO007
MISISGIKYQKELETLPYFNKKQAGMLIGKKGKNLDKKLEQLVKIGYLLNFKKGAYTTITFYEKSNKTEFAEYIANTLRLPSYISLEYVLSKENLIPEAVYSITSITIKTSRTFNNFLGSFLYKNIKKDLFLGYQEKRREDKKIYQATKSKALFDFLYLKKLVNVKQELTNDLRINWDNFTKTDLLEFKKYVKISSSKKMENILEVINSYVN